MGRGGNETGLSKADRGRQACNERQHVAPEGVGEPAAEQNPVGRADHVGGQHCGCDRGSTTRAVCGTVTSHD
jgi:hypothetical protein